MQCCLAHTREIRTDQVLGAYNYPQLDNKVDDLFAIGGKKNFRLQKRGVVNVGIFGN